MRSIVGGEVGMYGVDVDDGNVRGYSAGSKLQVAVCAQPLGGRH